MDRLRSISHLQHEQIRRFTIQNVGSRVRNYFITFQVQEVNKENGMKNIKAVKNYHPAPLMKKQ
jgi:hypothetical protein